MVMKRKGIWTGIFKVYDLVITDRKIQVLIQSKQKGTPSLFEGMPLFTRNES
jgi:hypothetical protein